MTYATDTDLDALDFIIINSPTHGKLSGTSSTTNPFIYTPDVGYLGDDSFSFKAFDGFLTSPTSTISLSIIIPELKTATETEEIPPVTIFSGGGGGGGGSSGGGSFVIPNPNLNISTSTKSMGKVLGASIDLSATSTDDTCGNYLSPDTVIGPGLKNNKNQVILLQRFLNRELNLKLPLLRFYGRATQAAVKTFQLKYRKDILDPWGIVDPTPYVYSTTVAKINSLVCPAMKSSLEDLKLIPINLSTPAN